MYIVYILSIWSLVIQADTEHLHSESFSSYTITFRWIQNKQINYNYCLSDEIHSKYLDYNRATSSVFNFIFQNRELFYFTPFFYNFLFLLCSKTHWKLSKVRIWCSDLVLKSKQKKNIWTTDIYLPKNISFFWEIRMYKNRISEKLLIIS